MVYRAKAGIQFFRDILDPGFRRGDDWGDFLRVHLDLSRAISPDTSIAVCLFRLLPGFPAALQCQPLLIVTLHTFQNLSINEGLVDRGAPQPELSYSTSYPPGS